MTGSNTTNSTASACAASSRWQLPINVGKNERILSLLGGGAVAIYGIARGGRLGAALGLLGGCLASRGLSGYCAAYDALGINTEGTHGRRTSIPSGEGVRIEETLTINRPVEELYKDEWDAVREASEESFPASDAPSWTTGR